MNKLHGLFISGLLLPWDDPRVFVPLAESLSLSGYTLAKWNDETIAISCGDPLLVVGHSLGGERAVSFTRGYGAKILCLMDPVHRDWSLSPIVKPPDVDLAICFNRDKPGFELPPCVGFVDPALNVYRDIRHDKFPTDPLIAKWLQEACRRMEKA